MKRFEHEIPYPEGLQMARVALWLSVAILTLTFIFAWLRGGLSA